MISLFVYLHSNWRLREVLETADFFAKEMRMNVVLGVSVHCLWIN